MGDDMLRALKGIFSRGNPLLQSLIIGQLSTVAGAFLINVLSARAMGPENRGEIAFILQMSYLAGALVPLGRDRSILQASIPSNTKKDIYSVLGQIALLPAGIICLLGLTFGIWRLAIGDTPVVALGFFLLLIGNLASRLFRAEAIVSGRGSLFLVATMVGQTGLVTAGGSLLLAGQDAVAPWLIAYGLSLSVPFLALTLIRGRPAPIQRQADIIGETRSLGIRLLPSTLIDMCMTKADKLLLPILDSYASLGYYAVAISLVDFSILPFRQFVDSRIPRWARLNDTGDLNLASVILRPLAYAVGAVVLVTALAYAAIPLLFGIEYVPALRILPWLALASVSHILTIVLAGVATAAASTQILSRMYAFGILCSLPLHFLLIPPFGATGAAIAQSAGYVGSTLVGFTMLWRSLGKSNRGES